MWCERSGERGKVLNLLAFLAQKYKYWRGASWRARQGPRLLELVKQVKQHRGHMYRCVFVFYFTCFTSSNSLQPSLQQCPRIPRTGTRFTCGVGTNVHILTQKTVQGARPSRCAHSCWSSRSSLKTLCRYRV